jgi:hypothetical protein
MKNSNESPTFWLVAQCLKQMRHHAPTFTNRYGVINSERLSFRQQDFHVTLYTWFDWVF